MPEAYARVFHKQEKVGSGTFNIFYLHLVALKRHNCSKVEEEENNTIIVKRKEQ